MNHISFLFLSSLSYSVTAFTMSSYYVQSLLNSCRHAGHGGKQPKYSDEQRRNLVPDGDVEVTGRPGSEVFGNSTFIFCCTLNLMVFFSDSVLFDIFHLLTRYHEYQGMDVIEVVCHFM